MENNSIAVKNSRPYEEELSLFDEIIFKKITRIDLIPQEVDFMINPNVTFKDIRTVLAIHWHPENVPVEIAKKRIQNMYPSKSKELIIPTQHNRILSYDGYSGLEMDCYAKEFNRKIQLLLHFKNQKLKNAHILNEMVNHTFSYRTGQLLDFMDAIINPKRINLVIEAANETGADSETVKFVKKQVQKIKKLMDSHEFNIPAESLKNKLVANFIIALQDLYPFSLLNKSLVFLNSVKNKVKRDFNLDYFFRVQEVIEETRKIGGCIIVPHPEQFWPVLLAEYDIDGYEIWNPQSREYTEFIISIIIKNNTRLQSFSKPLLATMGDDTHLGEKLKDPEFRDPEKINREIGFQPAWFDKTIQGKLKSAGFSKEAFIDEYIARLN